MTNHYGKMSSQPRLHLARWCWMGAVMLVVVLTAAVIAADGPLAGEVALIRWLQRFGEPVPTFADVMRATTGTEGNLVIGVVPAAVVVTRHRRRGALAVAICAAAMLVVQPVSKEIIDRDRPDATQVEVRAEHTSRAYPSGHSLSTATVWGAMSLSAWRARRRRWAGAAALPIVATAFASGIHGVHWMSDAIAGTVIGLGAAQLAVATIDGSTWWRWPRAGSAIERLPCDG